VFKDAYHLIHDVIILIPALIQNCVSRL